MQTVLTTLWTILSALPPFLFVMGIVVFIHEMGHYLVGRACGVKVEAFSLGFGPKLFAFRDKKGTQWRLSAIPLGGYVRFKNDGSESADHSFADAPVRTPDLSPPVVANDSFLSQPIWKRAAIIAAGPAANFVLAFALFVFSFMVVGRLVIAPVIGDVMENSAAQNAGFKPGDRVVFMDGKAVPSFETLTRRVLASGGQPIRIVFERDGSQFERVVTPTILTRKSVMGTERRAILGVLASQEVHHQHHHYYAFGEAMEAGLDEVRFVVERTTSYFGGVVIGRESVDQISGPARIAYVSRIVSQSGFYNLLMLMAMISISIGILNLLPLPMLDGGHLAFYALEALRGRPLSLRAQEWSFRFGIAMVMSLMVLSTFNDITHLTKLLYLP